MKIAEEPSLKLGFKTQSVWVVYFCSSKRTSAATATMAIIRSALITMGLILHVPQVRR
jgi:hypothetical protein